VGIQHSLVVARQAHIGDAYNGAKDMINLQNEPDRVPTQKQTQKIKQQLH
jgi:hypothetical protein